MVTVQAQFKTLKVSVLLLTCPNREVVKGSNCPDALADANQLKILYSTAQLAHHKRVVQGYVRLCANVDQCGAIVNNNN